MVMIRKTFFYNYKRADLFGHLLSMMLLLLLFYRFGDASVNGSIKDFYTVPQKFAKVQFWAPSSDSILYETNSDTGGLFHFDSIVEQQYRIKITPTDSSSYSPQWYSNTGNTLYPQDAFWIGNYASDTLKIILENSPIDNPPYSQIKVRIVDPSGIPITDSAGTVQIYRQNLGSVSLNFQRLDLTGTAIFNGLCPSGYSFSVNVASYPQQFYDTVLNASYLNTWVTVGKNDTQTVIVHMTKAPRGYGCVRGKCLTSDGLPASGISVQLYSQSDTTSPMYDQYTDANGAFSFRELYNDYNYYIRLIGSDYPPQWYSKSNNNTTLCPTELYTFMSSMYDSFYISLSKSPIDNAPKSKVGVSLYGKDDQLITNAEVMLINKYSRDSIPVPFLTSNNYYVFSGIGYGTYILRISAQGYPVQYWTPTGNTLYESNALNVNSYETNVTSYLIYYSDTSTNVNQNGYISGKVTDQYGPVTGAHVVLSNITGDKVSESTTDTQGCFSPMKLDTNVTYYLWSEAAGYQVGYWLMNGSTSNLSSSNYFVSKPGDTIKAVLDLKKNQIDTITPPPQVQKISGTVKSDAGIPIYKARIVLLQSDFNANYYCPDSVRSQFITFSDSSGNFSFSNITAGEYFVMAEADSQNLVAQFFNLTDTAWSGKRIIIGANSQVNLTFIMRQGGIIKGTVKDNHGLNLNGVHIRFNQINGPRWYESVTAMDGSFEIKGLPAGTYLPLTVKNDYYLDQSTKQIEINVTEKQVTEAVALVVETGGRIQGTVTSPFSSTAGIYSGILELFSDSLLAKQDKFIFPDGAAGIRISNSTETGFATFISDLCPIGKFSMLFSPLPISSSTPTAISDTMNFITGSGWCFLGSDTMLNSMHLYAINKFDTIKNVSLSLRKGYSVFGKVKSEDGMMIKGNYWVNAFVKNGDRFIAVSRSYILADGRFELAGLVEGEEYFIQVWADGYPTQFWSPSDGSVAEVSSAYKFSSTSFKSLDILISKNPAGSSVSMPGPINLWIDQDSAAAVLKWSTNGDGVSDTFKVYASDRKTGTIHLESIPKSAGSLYSYKDIRDLDVRQTYCITGKNDSAYFRSNRVEFEPRQKNVAAGSLWIDTYMSKSEAVVEWGTSTGITLSGTDSVDLYKKKDGDVWKRICRQAAFNREIGDYDWNVKDSGKSCLYRVEISSRNLRSREMSFTFNGDALKYLTSTFMVGPYEKYKTIQAAVDAAPQFGIINVRSGTYRENVNLNGKVLNVNGNWEFGRPPVIDGGGKIAITAEYSPKSMDRNQISISGFKIQNASIGIQTGGSIQINRTLFVNVKKAVDVSIDSVAMIQALKTDPVLSNCLNVNVWQCTFVARNSGDLAANVSATGISEKPGYNGPFLNKGDLYIQPVVSLTSRINFNNSIIADYYSVGHQSSIPVTFTGVSSGAWIRHCEFSRTNVTYSSSRVSFDSAQLKIELNFPDTNTYFVSSNLLPTIDGESIGYDAELKNGGSDSFKNQPSSVKNLVATTVGLRAIMLSWDQAPFSENIKSYRIYRAPGDTSLFYVNEKSQWEPKLPEDSIFRVIDTFSTKSTFFLDTTIEPGKPYLYVVGSIDTNGIEGVIDLPASKPISSFIVNVYQYNMRIAAGKWYMVSPWGMDNLGISNQSTFIYQWDDKKEPDKLLGQYSRATEMIPGNGYWLKVSEDTTLNVNLSSLTKLSRSTDTAEIHLRKGTSGWNQIASRFPFPVSPSWMSFIPVWEWNPDSLGYTRAKQLSPWKAYWIYCENDTDLILLEKPSETSANKLFKSVSKVFWDLRVSLRSAGGWDIDNHIGITAANTTEKSIMSQPEPPQAFGSSQLYFVNENGSTLSDGRLACQYKISKNAIPPSKIQWITAMTPTETPSVLTIDGIKTLPQKLHAFWVDERGAVDLRNSDSISFASHAKTIFGAIVVTGNEADVKMYMGKPSLFTPYPNPFRGAAVIEYVLPYDWSAEAIKNGGNRKVKITIYNLSGRLIKNLVNTVEPAGMHRVIWNGDNGRARQTPAGIYIVKMESGKFEANKRVNRLR